MKKILVSIVVIVACLSDVEGVASVDDKAKPSTPPKIFDYGEYVEKQDSFWESSQIS